MNISLRQQQTIAQPARVSGIGYWSGRDVNVEFRPAEPDSGITFVRSDLQSSQPIPSTVQYRVETPRRTNLTCGGVTVEMVEHVMAALAGLKIDNCQVCVDSPEMPGCDGSSLPFVEALDQAGAVAQNALRAQLTVTDITRVGDEESWVEARPSRHGGLLLKYRLDYGSQSPIGRQTIEMQVTPDVFRKELAPARTFLLKEEADWLRQQGLGQTVTYQDLLVFDQHGPIENQLRFANECVRHKTLDLIGDLALAGCDIVGQITAYRSGHRLNAELVQAMLAESCIEDQWRKTA